MSPVPLLEDPALVVALKTIALVLGGTITWVSYRAWRRTDSRALRALTVGFALVTVGSIIGGGLHQLLGLDLQSGVAIQSLFTVAGFSVITYAVFLREPDGEPAPLPGDVDRPIE